MNENTESLHRLDKIKGKIELLGSLQPAPVPHQVIEDMKWMEKQLRLRISVEKNQKLFLWETYESPIKGSAKPHFESIDGASTSPFNGLDPSLDGIDSLDNLKEAKGKSDNLSNIDLWRQMLKLEK